MTYDGKGKILSIKCEEKVWSHRDLNWPEEAYFFFTLLAGQVTLLS